MTLTVVWHDVVLIANPITWFTMTIQYLLYIRIIKKRISPVDEFVIPFPPYHISAKLYSPLYQICLFSVPPPPPPTHTHTHRKNDWSLRLCNIFIFGMAYWRHPIYTDSLWYSLLFTKSANTFLQHQLVRTVFSYFGKICVEKSGSDLLKVHSWQSFVIIGSCTHLMRIISTYVGNIKDS